MKKKKLRKQLNEARVQISALQRAIVKWRNEALWWENQIHGMDMSGRDTGSPGLRPDIAKQIAEAMTEKR